MSTREIQDEEERVGHDILISPQFNPVVLIERNQDLDKTAAALSAKSNAYANSCNSCFLCGQLSLPAQEGSHYLEIVTLFKTYLNEDEESVETCANCVQDVTAVWEITQQIKTLQQELATIVETVTGTRKRDKVLIIGQEQNCNGSNWISPTLQFEVKEEIPFWEHSSHNKDYFEEIKALEVKQELDYEESSVPTTDPIRLHCNSLQRSRRKKRPARDPLAFSDEEEVNPETIDPTFNKADIITPNLQTYKWSCSHCGKALFSADTLRKHIRSVHQGHRPYSCDHCGQSFTSLFNKRRHIQRAHRINETFPCSLCAKALSSRRRRAIHEAVICKVEGMSVERLREEFKVVLLPCPEPGCDKMFEQSRLKKHTSSHNKRTSKHGQP